MASTLEFPECALSRTGQRHFGLLCSGSGCGLHSPRWPAEGDKPPLFPGRDQCVLATGLVQGAADRHYVSSGQASALASAKCRILSSGKAAKFPQDLLGGASLGGKLEETVGGCCWLGPAGRRKSKCPQQHWKARGEDSDFELALCVVCKEVCLGFFFFWGGVMFHYHHILE